MKDAEVLEACAKAIAGAIDEADRQAVRGVARPAFIVGYLCAALDRDDLHQRAMGADVVVTREMQAELERALGRGEPVGPALEALLEQSARASHVVIAFPEAR